MPYATLTSKGQVTIPKPVRDRLRLKAGDRIEFSAENEREGRIVVHGHGLADLAASRVGARRRPLSIADMDRAVAEGAIGRGRRR